MKTFKFMIFEGILKIRISNIFISLISLTTLFYPLISFFSGYSPLVFTLSVTSLSLGVLTLSFYITLGRLIKGNNLTTLRGLGIKNKKMFQSLLIILVIINVPNLSYLLAEGLYFYFYILVSHLLLSIFLITFITIWISNKNKSVKTIIFVVMMLSSLFTTELSMLSTPEMFHYSIFYWINKSGEIGVSIIGVVSSIILSSACIVVFRKIDNVYWERWRK